MESDPKPGSAGEQGSVDRDGDPAGTPEGDPAGTGEAGGEAGGDTASGAMEGGRDPLRFSNWMKSSATGAVMTGIAFGLKEALQPRRDEIPFVIEAPGEPDDPDNPIDLRFDPDSPADTVAIIRRPNTADGQGPPTTPA